MRARVNRGRGLAAQLLERVQRIWKSGQAPRAGFHVAGDERPVLVERPLAAVVLLERKRNLGAGLDLLREQGEAREPEETQRAVEVRSAYGHALRLRGWCRLSSS